MKCPGLHCKGCGDSGGSGLGLVIALVVLAAVVAPAVEAVLRVVVDVLEIAAITLVSLAGLGLVAGGVVVGVRVRRQLAARRAARELPAPAVHVVPSEAVRVLPVYQAQRPAVLRRRPGTVPALGPGERPWRRRTEPPRARR